MMNRRSFLPWLLSPLAAFFGWPRPAKSNGRFTDTFAAVSGPVGRFSRYEFNIPPTTEAGAGAMPSIVISASDTDATKFKADFERLYRGLPSVQIKLAPGGLAFKDA